jgi:hypothetical protein
VIDYGLTHWCIIFCKAKGKKSCNRLTHNNTNLFKHPKVINKKAALNVESGDFIAKLNVYLTVLGSQQKTLQIKFLTKNQVKSTLLNYRVRWKYAIIIFTVWKYAIGISLTGGCHHSH